MWQDINKDSFDLIIDDGLHTFDASVTFFDNSFSKLKKTGVYIIEDVHFAYLNKLATRLKVNHISLCSVASKVKEGSKSKIFHPASKIFPLS